MSVADRIPDRLYYEGIIDEPRDLPLAVGFGLLGLAAVLLALSPAIGLYFVARHAGMAFVPAVFVGFGGYGALLLHLRFGGINVNVNQ